MQMLEKPFCYLAVAWFALAGCAESDSLTPPTPPLLRNVSATGGWWNAGCPPTDATEARLYEPSEEALSPELTQRLTRQFPEGSDANRLVQTLKEQGFDFHSPCKGLPAIHLSEFRQSGGQLFGPYPIWAQVVWEQDDAGRIMWTKGTVAFTGP